MKTLTLIISLLLLSGIARAEQIDCRDCNYYAKGYRVHCKSECVIANSIEKIADYLEVRGEKKL